MHELSDELNELSYQIIGAAIEVHKSLGPGFKESVYQRALQFELNMRGIQFVREAKITLTYKGQSVGDHKLDFWIEKKIVVELKAVDTVIHVHEAQLLSYLRATNSELGLLINFNMTKLTDGIQRIINTT